MADLQFSAVLRTIHHLAATDRDDERTDGQLLDAFLEAHDQAAFGTLVRRHGPMVLGVCRRVLHHAQDAEDAFQATFLVLFRRAKSLDRRGSLAGWLHAVAQRAALKARTGLELRKRQQRQVRPMPPTEPDADALWNDLKPVLDEEVSALPEKYRLPVLLCYFEGKTNVEAARLLGWPAGTVKGRLSRAKDLLRKRLTRRGITMTAAALSIGLGEHARAAVSHTLIDATVTLALAGGPAALTTPATKLASRVLRSLTAAKIKTTTALVLGFLALGLASGIWAQRAFLRSPNNSGDKPTVLMSERASEKPKQALQPVDLSRPMAVHGRILGPGGKPVPKAHVAVLIQAGLPGGGGDFTSDDPETLVELTAGADGRFQWKGRRPPFGTFGKAFLLAKAKGLGLAWAHLSADGSSDEQILRLAPERAVHGRLLDHQGQPAAGVKLLFDGCGVAGRGEFDGIQSWGRHPRLPSFWPAGPIVTDSAGRFTLRGFDDRQNVGATVRDPRFAYQPVAIPGGPHPKEVTIVLVPGQTIEGTVLVADTGKPLPHARLVIYANDQMPDYFGTGMGDVADAEGHFRINPWRGKFFGIAAFAPDGTPYLTLEKNITWPLGAVKQTVDMRLPRGVLVRGKILEAGTGRPIPGASVQYWPRNNNKSEYRRQVLTGWSDTVVSARDGSFAMAVLPGPGTLLLNGPTLDFVHHEIGSNELYTGKRGGQRYYADAAVKVDLPANATHHDVAISLKRGATVRGSIVGPDGKPVAEALMLWRHYVSRTELRWRWPLKVVGDRFELHGFDPEATEEVYFLDPKNRNGATVLISAKQTNRPLTVQLRRCGQARVRYVDDRGKPLARQQPWLKVVVTPGAWMSDMKAFARGELEADGNFLSNVDRVNYLPGPLSGADGRCTLPALIPGCRYQIMMRLRKDSFKHPEYWRQFRVKSGETLDLGDIVVEK